MRSQNFVFLAAALFCAPLAGANPPAADSSAPMHAAHHKMWEHHAMMGHPMMGPACPIDLRGPQMVATADGGVIVLCGMHLYRYDKNLNLKKSEELPCAKEEDMGKGDEDMGPEHCAWQGHDDDSAAKKTAPKPPEKK